ncbi:hypothetical protein EniLVp02_0044 [Vibrio phage EniLVp02]
MPRGDLDSPVQSANGIKKMALSVYQSLFCYIINPYPH